MRKVKFYSAIFIMVLMISLVVFSIVYLTKKEKEYKVITTIFPIYDICREIMGSEDELMLLQDNGADMHSFTPTANDITTISKSELFIFVGGESDKWVGDVIRSANNVNLKTLSLMEIENLTKLEESHENIISPGDHDHEHEHEHEEGETFDEHIWLSIKNAIVMTESIRDSLSLVFPEKQELFKVNAKAYIDKLVDLDNQYEEYLKDKNSTIIVADRFPLRYLVNDYDINYYAIFTGCSAETEASTEAMATLINKINENNVDYILVLETSDKSIANSCISNHNCKQGLEILVINSCQSIMQSTLQTSSYLGIMGQNLEILKKAISR